MLGLIIQIIEFRRQCWIIV